MTVIETIEWAQDPLQDCGGQPIIPEAGFLTLAVNLILHAEVTKPQEELMKIFKAQSLRFTACGANNADGFGVLRRNPESGWAYLLELILE